MTIGQAAFAFEKMLTDIDGCNVHQKRILVSIIRDGLENQLRESVDTWPITNDAIVICSLGKDTKGKRLPPLARAYFSALRWCVAIEESTEWSDRLERRLVVSLHRCAEPEAVSKSGSKGGRESAKRKKDTAAGWQTMIEPKVKRFILAGKTDSFVGAQLASKAGKSAETVRKFAAKIQVKK